MNNRKVIQVLLVEDNPSEARQIQNMLAEVGSTSFNLKHVQRLQEAHQSLREEKYDVVLLDLVLPEAKGLSPVGNIRDEFPKIPIVILTGLSDEMLARQAIQMGAQDYVIKGQSGGNLVSRSLRYAIELKRFEEHLSYLANYDLLTGLANRTLFRDRLNQAVARGDRSGEQVALLFLNLDNFKAINDTMGHEAGDMLLKAIAERLYHCVRKTDTLARLGGDEYAIILEGISTGEDPAAVAGKIIETLEPPFVLLGREVFITTSIGITLYPSDAENIDELLKFADRAMHRAKDQGCDQYQFYAAEMNVRATERLTFRSSLFHALDRNEFLLHYQPMIDLENGRIVGVEALLRWQLPNYGLLYPDRFISLAEETELIASIGEWVLRTACDQSRVWRESGLPPLRISVNLSARQFRRMELATMIEQILMGTGTDPGDLELELTELTLMDNTENSNTTLNLLKQLGVRISIDDFGTGYSSLSYLKRFPIDSLKIARTFVQDITTNSDGAAVARAIIALAQSLRLEVVAEGVETEGQMNVLRELGCDLAQGFYFSEPLPTDAVSELVASGRQLIGQ